MYILIVSGIIIFFMYRFRNVYLMVEHEPGNVKILLLFGMHPIEEKNLFQSPGMKGLTVPVSMLCVQLVPVHWSTPN